MNRFRVVESVTIPDDLEDRSSPPERVGIKRFFLEAFMSGGLAGIGTSLLVVRADSGRLAAVSAVSRIRLVIDCIAPAAIQRLASAIRRIRPSFLEFDLLMCGIPASLADQETSFAAHLSAEERTAVRHALVGFSSDLIEREGQAACVWKEFDHTERDRWHPALDAGGFLWFPSVPVSVQDVTWSSPEEYVSRVRAPYRRQLAQNIARARAAGLTIENDVDLSPHVTAFYPFYLQVLDRSKTRLETLSLAFFQKLALDPRVRFIRAAKEGRTVGGALCYVDAPEVLVFLYVGMDYGVLRQCDLYFNLLKAIADLAAVKGVRHIRWGQTSPDAKGRMGAVLEPLSFAMRFRHPSLQRLLGLVGPFLFPRRTQIERKVMHQGIG